MRSSSRRAVFCCTGLLLAACATSPDGSSAWRRHFDGGIWAGALQAQVENPAEWVPALGLAGATAYAFHADHWLERKALEGNVTGGDTRRGDAADVGLGVLGAGVAATGWALGDGGESAETLVESFLLVEGATEGLKNLTHRQRPSHGTGRDSFPSGHTSFAFTMATCIARGVDDLGDGWYDKLGYLAYLPAAYVGINRCEGNRHWPSDVAFGALLGVALTNLVHDVHYGSPGHRGIYGEPAGASVSLEPEPEERGMGVALVLRF